MARPGYRDLTVWQEGMRIARQCYTLTSRFPRHELHGGLGAQIRNAAVAIPANLAEGHARPTTRQYLYHVGIAQGSSAELETLLDLTIGTYAEAGEVAPLIAALAANARRLNRLRQSLLARAPAPAPRRATAVTQRSQ